MATIRNRVRRTSRGDDVTGFTHKDCGGEIAYNGNYFCEHWLECGGVSTCAEFDEDKQEWGPAALIQQEKELAVALGENRAGRYRERGELRLL